MYGGMSRITGQRSFLDINSIIAGRGIALLGSWDECTPTLTNESLFRRDNHICMYCGSRFPTSMLTRDHEHPGQADPASRQQVAPECAAIRMPGRARTEVMHVGQSGEEQEPGQGTSEEQSDCCSGRHSDHSVTD